MRRSTLLTALAFTLVACGDAKAPKDDAKAEAKTDAKADAKAPDAKAADAKEGEKSEEEKKAEAEKRGKERLEKLAKKTEEEKARWTDEVKAAAKELSGEHADLASGLEKILAGAHRMPGNPERDQYRHPKETLAFFGVTPESTVLEIGPGAGWYTEILAPLLAAKGKLIVTDYPLDGPPYEYATYNAKRLKAFLERSEDMFGKVERVISPDSKNLSFGEPESVDIALVIRGIHGWQNRDQLTDNLKKVHAVLKPGGTFGVVQHRGKEGSDPKETADKGYLPQAHVIEQAKAAGFELVEASEINANPKDTADHPEGVWNLPPTLTDEDKDRDKYVAIGESDRMTLKFTKK